MNSKQRRKTERAFPYTVKLQAKENERWFDLDDREDQARAWCRKHTKHYHIHSKYDGDIFCFASAEMATLFSLRWL